MADNGEAKVIATKEDGTVIRFPMTEEEFAKIERLENAEIEKRMVGDLLNIYVYNFSNSRGEIITDLSAKGYETCAQMYSSIKCSVESKDSSGPSHIVVIAAHDKIRDLTLLGGAEEEKRSENGRENKFAFAKAITKGQRNALKKILPEPLIHRLVLRYIENQEEAERAAAIEGIKQMIADYSCSMEKFNVYCLDNYGVTIDGISLEVAIKARASLNTKKGRQQFMEE